MRLTAICYQHTVYPSNFDKIEQFYAEIGAPNLKLVEPTPAEQKLLTGSETGLNGFKYFLPAPIQQLNPRVYYITKYVDWIKLDIDRLLDMLGSNGEGNGPDAQLLDPELSNEIRSIMAISNDPQNTGTNNQTLGPFVKRNGLRRQRSASMTIGNMYRAAGECIRLHNVNLLSPSEEKRPATFTVQLLDRRECYSRDILWLDSMKPPSSSQTAPYLFSIEQKSGTIEPGGQVSLKINLRNHKGDYLDGNAGRKQVISATKIPEEVEAIFKITLQGGFELQDYCSDATDGIRRIILLRIRTRNRYATEHNQQKAKKL